MRRVVASALLLMLALAGCRATGPASPSTTRPDDPSPGPFPVVVESDLGPVTIAAEPVRIVSMSATHTEMLYAVGAGEHVVATDLTSNYPPAAEGTAKVDSFNFNVEEVAALDPDLVILAFDFQGEAAALTAVGIPFLLLGPPATLDGAFAQLRALGAAVGRAGAADELANELEAEADHLVAAGDRFRGTTFFHEIDDTLFTASSASFVGDLYARLGLVNIADPVAEGPYLQLSGEYIVDQDPDFIFLADAGFGVTAGAVAGRPGWSAMTAVAEERVVELDGDMAGRWGPRTVELMRSISEALGRGLP